MTSVWFVSLCDCLLHYYIYVPIEYNVYYTARPLSYYLFRKLLAVADPGL